MSDQSDPLLFHHDYDGIQEQDNPAPRWLTRTFIGCIVFAGAYFTYFHVLGKGQTNEEKFQTAWASFDQERKAAQANETIQVTEDLMKSGAADAETIARGKAIFTERCTGCHTDNGRGLVGPNLTDDFQIHGHTRVDIFDTVDHGVPEKAMPAWGEQLPQHDVLAVATYVTTLRGTNVPGGKAPQGDKVEHFAP